MAQTLKAIKLQLMPDERSARCLDDQSRKCNSLYNMLLQIANELLKEYKRTQDPELANTIFSKYGLRNLVPILKERHPYLKSVYVAPLKNAALRLTSSIRDHQDSKHGRRKGKVVGWPNFLSIKRSFFSLLYDEPYKGYAIKGTTLHLSLGLGMDRKRHSLQIPIMNAHLLKGKHVHTLRIIKENGLYFAIFTIIATVPEPKQIKKVLTLDPNHKNFAYGVDNEGKALEIEAAHWLKPYDRRIDKLRAKIDRCKKESYKVIVYDEQGNIITERWEPSRRYKKLIAALDKLLAKRREQTKVFCFTLAHKLFKQYDLIAIGDYAPYGQGKSRKMRRAMNNRSMIGRFKGIVSWVAIKSGKHYKEYDERGTTRTCHSCGFIVEGGIDPSIREWVCSSCNVNHIRDENAAINGLRKVIKEESEEIPSLVPSSGHVLVQERSAWKVLSSGVRVHRGDKAIVQSILPRN